MAKETWYGWAGTILRVDLTKREVVKEPLGLEFAKKFLGGQGFAQKLIFDAYDFSETDPLAPSNIIAVAPGTLAGTLSPGASRLSVSVARSPATGGYIDANAGGFFGPEMKYAGYDILMITGRAEDLVYISILDDEVEIRDAQHLRGKSVFETVRTLKLETGIPTLGTALIGPSGENMVIGAMVTVDLYRAASGGSTGAVFGSKNCKGVVAKGTRGIRVHNPDEAFEVFHRIFDKNRREPRFKRFGEQGTKWLLPLSGTLNCQYNVQYKEFPYDKLAVEKFMEEHNAGTKACHACFQHCDHHWEIKKGKFKGEKAAGGEAGTLIPLGPICGNSEYPDILHLSNVVNDQGLDSIATGATIATFMHWWQEGLIDGKDTDGLELEWGDTEVQEQMIYKLSRREKGLGEILALGTHGAAEHFAKKKKIPLESYTKLIRANKKKREVTADFRALKGLALSKAIDIRECDILNTDTLLAEGNVDLDRFVHIGVPREIAEVWADSYISNPLVFDDKSIAKFYSDNHTTVCNSTGTCQRYTTWAQMRMGLEDIADSLRPITGIPYTWKDLYSAGDRIRQVEQAFQLLFGFRKEDDFFPDHYYNNPIEQGRFEGAFMDKDEYRQELENLYEMRGWTKEGFPRRSRLENLGLADIAERLERAGLLGAEK